MPKVFELLSLFLPIIAISGGITLAIVAMLSQARKQELAHRERIAAIQRGIAPSTLDARIPNRNAPTQGASA